jgi:hypothetical protein
MARRTFSIVDKDVLEFIDSMDDGTKSRYVVDLIRKDMKKGSKEYVTREEVMEMIKGLKVDSEDTEVKNSLMGTLNLG